MPSVVYLVLTLERVVLLLPPNYYYSHVFYIRRIQPLLSEYMVIHQYELSPLDRNLGPLRW